MLRSPECKNGLKHTLRIFAEIDEGTDKRDAKRIHKVLASKDPDTKGSMIRKSCFMG